MTALVAIGGVSFVWEQYFQSYTADNMRALADTTARRIANNYERTHSLEDPSTVVPASQVVAVTPGVGIKVVSANGDVVFDSSSVTEALGNATPLTLSEPIDSNKIAASDIMVNGELIGVLQLWVYGSDALVRQTDQIFRNNSYQALVIAGVVAIVIASCIGFFFARNLVAPVNRIARTARKIANGDFSARTELSGDDEIAQLGETFDKMAESVEKDRELERRLTTDVAHELRTPLMAIQATVEAMVDGVYEPSEERLVTVNAEVQRLGRLVDALLKLSRLESRTTPMKEEVIDLGELIGGIVATHEMFVVDSGLTLHYSADPSVLVKGDPDKIRQATANLISNAVRYTPEGGDIYVAVRRGLRMAAIEVRDTGIGLTREEARMVFSRFWRADAGRDREHGGLGIGLAVVKEIVDRHGGWVSVEGEKGKGACFTIHLPLYEEPSSKDQEQKGAKGGRSRNKNRS